MSFFKLMNAPKTQDTEYDDARSLFKTMSLDPGKFGSSVKSLIRSLQDLSETALKAATNFETWVMESPNDAGDVGLESKLILKQVTEFDNVTRTALLPKIQPNFLVHLEGYEQRVGEIHKMKEERMRAVKEFDKTRERVRLLENEKKPKQDKIDKAKAQSDEAGLKYEEANRQFIASVNSLNNDRKVTLGGPFKSLIAIFCQYLQKVGAGTSANVRMIDTPVSPRSSPRPNPPPPEEETPAPEPVQSTSTTTAWEQPAQQSDPWSQPAQQSDPWSQPAKQSDPWSEPAKQSDPWSQPAQASDPWGQPAQSGNLFGQPTSYAYQETKHEVVDPGYTGGDELQDDGWNNSFNPVEQGYVQQNQEPAYQYQEDDFGKNPFD